MPRKRTEGRAVESLWSTWILLLHVILPAALGPGVYSASKRNEYEGQKKNMESRGRPVREADLTAICEPIV
jgi:hypothetical protein